MAPAISNSGARPMNHGHFVGSGLRHARLEAARLGPCHPAGWYEIDPTPMPDPARLMKPPALKNRARRTDHETRAIEGLVHRGRLVDAADDRFDVVDAERPRVQRAVPTDDVERVVSMGVSAAPA